MAHRQKGAASNLNERTVSSDTAHVLHEQEGVWRKRVAAGRKHGTDQGNREDVYSEREDLGPKDDDDRSGWVDLVGVGQ